MKKQLLLIASIVSLSIFGCAKDKECTVNVKFTPEVLQKVKGQKLYITQDTVNLDSVLVDSSSFSFPKIGVKDNSLNYVYLINDKGNKISSFVLEEGIVNIDYNETGDSIYGTPINDAILKYSNEYSDMISKIMSDYNEATKDIDSASVRDSIQSVYEKEFYDKSYNISKSAFDSNKNNALGLRALLDLLQTDNIDIDERVKLIDEAGDLVKNSSEVKKVKDYLIKLKEVNKGSMFKDFEGLNDNGETVKLSDYVGKGKFVIVDFWASWCGPCIGEIPNLIKLYNDYKGKNVEVVGVAVRDEMENHLEAVKELKIPYPQIVNEKEAMEMYAIRGIPQIMLFAPDGTMIARDLRGPAIEEALKEALEENK